MIKAWLMRRWLSILKARAAVVRAAVVAAPYIPFAAVAIVMVAVVAYALFRLASPPPPPIHYTQAEYAAARAVLAPGASLVYTPTLEIKNAGRVTVLRTFWNRDTNQNAVLCSGQSAPIIEITRNLPASIVNDFRGGNAVHIPVPDLPNGRYWLLSSASGPGGGQSTYSVPFEVTNSCGG